MTSRWFIGAHLCAAFAVANTASAAIVPPILEYRLNDAGGSTVANTGTAGTPGDLTMFQAGNPGSSANLFSADSAGVSGLSGDRAYDNSVSGAMGTGPGGQASPFYVAPNRGPRATNDADNGILNGKTALTIAGWVKTEAGMWDGLSQVWAGDAGFFMNVRGGDGTIGNAGKIEFDFRTGANTFSALVRSSTADWNLENQWMFFAVTWDGSTGNVGMYYVDGSNQVQSTVTAYVSSPALGLGAIQDSPQMAGPGGNPTATYGVSLGNQGGYALRPFDGLLDNIRVFDAVVSQADLQTIVNKDLLNQALAHPGDFDGDGDVDGADFVAWQTNFPKASGATLDQGDADGDGDVDGADFVVWQTNFPFTPGPGASPVPEPAAWTMALLALGAAAIRFRRCREG